MTQIKSPTGFVSSLQTALKTASTDGKAVGAPVLKKALQGTDASQLSPQQKHQVRDAFEKVKLTPKARELADQFVGDGVGIKPPKDSGVLKVMMDDPTRGSKLPDFKPPDGGRVKVMMDDPTRGSKLPDFTPPDGGRVKVRMDDPTGGLNLPDFKPPEDIGVLKVMMDDPTRGSKLPDLKPLDGGILKVKMDSPV
ncbi:hypothetical protein HJC10_20670 [Corallococcus exiguus]|uniref:hypothetical protein n=1 Tax=Corallococcus TaxID=83461 RepID=UPI000EE6C395|nr:MULTISPECIES: hypothetical protein [Corallococcus]NNB85884.1 hypothetical protein [Corallococcus exiguus]NNB93938.1 hypothetical protein [Corallococcus exiguus]NNC05257.1 hypothetical protein [Corallococcus exiguus]NPC48892.1 hypothetical protein [Corallococcus exiguus]RKH85641.1 hypothetical protein D7X99_05980 [Corallococcus sp. AB032C]